MKYTLGLDLGIASIGWSLLNTDQQRIEALGVREFTCAETPKTRESLAKPRREARSSRRRLHRRANRLRKLCELFTAKELITIDTLDPAKAVQAVIEKSVANGKNPWQLRYEALDRKLSNDEFAQVLYHIVKHRGYKPNSRGEVKDSAKNKTEGEMLKSVLANDENARHYRTAGEMYAKDSTFSECKRNKGGQYTHTVSRVLLENEIIALFKHQQNFKHPFATDANEHEVLELFNRQKPFASGNDILKKAGYCTFEPPERRAPRACYTAELFSLTQRLNNLRWKVDGKENALSHEQRGQLIALAHDKKELKYNDIRKLIEVTDGDSLRFNLIRYERGKKPIETDKNRTFAALQRTHEIKKVLVPIIGEDEWNSFLNNPERIDKIGWILTFYKTDSDIRSQFLENGLSESITTAVIEECLSFDKVIHLSLKALYNVLPYMRNGKRYDEACKAAGYPKEEKSKRTPGIPVLPPAECEDLSNPVDSQSMSGFILS